MESRIRLRRRRFAAELASRRLSQNAWARRFGVSKAYLSQLLSGQRRYPGVLLRNRILQTLELPFEELFVTEEPEVERSRDGQPSRPAGVSPRQLLGLQVGPLKLKLEKESVPNSGRKNLMDHLWRDLRYAARGLRRNPAFSLLAVATLAVAIGANTTLFSAVHTVLLSPPPYPQPDRLVRIWGSNPTEGWRRGAVSPQNAFDLDQMNRTLDKTGTFNLRRGNLRAGEGARSIELALVTPALMAALAVEPLQGRLFSSRENEPGADGVALISSRLWTAAFGRDPDIAGRAVNLDGRRLIVIGVMPAQLHFPSPQTDLWKPFGMTPDDGGQRGSNWVYAVGRLADGVLLEQAQADVERVARDLEAAYPDANRNRSFYLETVHVAETRGVRQALLLLWGSVGLILLIACVNVANLLLGRAAARRRELAVRTVLGAGPARMLQQLLLECLLLAAVSTGAGLVVALGANRLLVWLADGRLPRSELIGMSGPVLVFAAGLTLLTTLLFGLMPAWQSVRVGFGEALRQRGAAARPRLRLALVAAQVCLALVLLTGAGLLLRSFTTLVSVDLGFEPDRLHTFRVEPPMLASGVGLSRDEFLPLFEAERRQAAGFYSEFLARLETIAGVTEVGAVNRRPLAGNMWQTRVAIAGRAIERSDDMLPATARNVIGGYFSSLGVPLLRGRLFDATDDASSGRVVVVNRTMADAYWPGQDPVGARITFMYPLPEASFWMEIVGVVDDVRHVGLTVDPIPVFYVPMSQALFGFFGDWGMDVMVRTSGEVNGLARQVQNVLRSVDASLPMSSFQSMDQALSDNASAQRFSLQLLGLFAAVALLLAFVGIYGVIAYMAAQRRQEFGIRAALGARPGQVLRLVAAQSAAVTLIGIAAGLLASLLMSGLISELLYGVSPTDPWTLLGAAGLMMAIGTGAGALPAWRAGRADPLAALRTE